MQVALYARVSSDRQDVDLSIAAQLRALRDHAGKNGHQVAREYVDEAESGRTADRPQFQRMVAEARRPGKPFQMVLVWKFSRFARSREDAIVFKSLLGKHGVRVVSITEPSEDTPTGKLLEAIIESLDEFYSVNLAQEVLRGMREAASRGFYVGSNTPYGYRRVKVLDGKKERPTLEPDPGTGPVVRRMFRAALDSPGLKDLCRMLNGEGVPGPRGKPWQKTTVYKILTNEAYTGTLVWGKVSKDGNPPDPVRVEGAWEALVDVESFKKVQETMRERSFLKVHPRRSASSFLLSGLVKCGNCGRSLTGQDAKSGRFAYYVCGTLLKRGRGTCDTPYLNARRFEEMLVEKLKERVLTEENLRELVKLVNEELDSVSHEYRDRLKTVEKEVADVQRRLDRLYDALETGKLTLDDLYPRIQQLRHRQDQLQAARSDLEGYLDERRESLDGLSEVLKYVDDMRALFEEGFAEKKAFIRTFVKEIVVEGGEAVVRYTLPMPPDALVGRKNGEVIALPSPVLSNVHDGGR